MNKEIEELLNKLCYEISCQAHYQKDNHLEICKNCICKCKQYELLEKILSNIETLQKDNKMYAQLKDTNEEIIEQLEKDNYDLDKENQILFKTNMELQNNRDKAIEYINKTVFNEKGYINFCYELENILKGDSDGN